MIACTFTTTNHIDLLDTFLRPTVDRMGLQLEVEMGERSQSRSFGGLGWAALMRRKAEAMLAAIRRNSGNTILWADTDVVLLRRFDPEQLLNEYDIAAQVDDANGQLCAGLLLIRCNRRTIELYEAITGNDSFYCPDNLMSDQGALNHFKSVAHCKTIPYEVFWSPGGRDGSKTQWRGIERIEDIDNLVVPSTVSAVHANWCVGHERKARILRRALDSVHGTKL